MPYPFDPTGESPANLISAEQHIITVPAVIGDPHFIVAFIGPFFEAGLTVTHYPTGATLTHGVDFSFGYKFLTASISCGKNIFGGIVFYDQTLEGTIELDYQTLGGDWEIDEAQALTMKTSAVTDPRSTSWEEVVALPNEFPVVSHEYNINDMIGEDDLITSIEEIVTEVTAGQTTYDAAMWEYVKRALALQRVARWHKQTLIGAAPGQIVNIAMDEINPDVMVAMDNTGLTIRTDDDGLTWTPQVAVANGLLAYGNGVFLIIPPAQNEFITSADGITYISRGNAMNVTFHSLKFLNGLFIAVGTSGTIITSADGITWDARVSNTTETLHDVTWGDGKYVVVGENNTLLRSLDLIDWQAPAIVPITDITDPLQVTFGNNIFIVSNGLKLFITADVDVWTSTSTLDMPSTIDSLSFGFGERGVGVFTAIGLNMLLASTNGTEWSSCYIEGSVTPTMAKSLKGKYMLATTESNSLYRAMCVLIDTTVLSGGTPTYSQVVYLT